MSKNVLRHNRMLNVVFLIGLICSVAASRGGHFMAQGWKIFFVSVVFASCVIHMFGSGIKNSPTGQVMKAVACVMVWATNVILTISVLVNL